MFCLILCSSLTLMTGEKQVKNYSVILFCGSDILSFTQMNWIMYFLQLTYIRQLTVAIHPPFYCLTPKTEMWWICIVWTQLGEVSCAGIWSGMKIRTMWKYGEHQEVLNMYGHNKKLDVVHYRHKEHLTIVGFFCVFTLFTHTLLNNTKYQY